MPDIDPQIGQRIANAARAVSIIKSQLERARNWEETQALQAQLDQAEREMNDAAMQVNRGLSRAAPAP